MSGALSGGPSRGISADARNIYRCVKHRGAHYAPFHSPRQFSEARVRRKGPGAHGVTSHLGGRDCRCEFRQARSRAPLPDSVLAVGGATDGVWQGGSVMSTLRRGPCRTSRHDRGRRKTPRDPRCDRAETLAEPGIPSTAAGILLQHHRNSLPRSWRRGGRRGSCSSSAARAETLSDRQEDLRDHRKILRNPEKIAKNHENMAKRAKNVLLAISSGGGFFYIFVAMVN